MYKSHFIVFGNGNVQPTHWPDVSGAAAAKVNTGRRCCVLDCWRTQSIYVHLPWSIVLSCTENMKHIWLRTFFAQTCNLDHLVFRSHSHHKCTGREFIWDRTESVFQSVSVWSDPQPSAISVFTLAQTNCSRENEAELDLNRTNTNSLSKLST